MAIDYSIWAFRYARSNMPRDFFGGTLVESNTGTVRNPMVYSAIVGGADGDKARPIVIDTGMKGDFSPSGKGYENVEDPARRAARGTRTSRTRQPSSPRSASRRTRSRP